MASFSGGFGIQTTEVVRKLLFLYIGVFILEFILKFAYPPLLINILTFVGLSPGLVLDHFFIWQILTYNILHDPNSILHILFQMLALWMFGSSLEAHWGTRNFVKYYLFCVFGGGVLPILTHVAGFHSTGVIGTSAAVGGMIIAYGLIWPNRELLIFGLFPMKAKYYSILFLVILGFVSLSSGVPVSSEIGGALFGILYFLYYTKIKYRFGISLPSFSFSRWRQKRKMNRWQDEMKNREKAKEEVDRLLEKISKEGINSLNRKEKKFLKEASAKYYDAQQH
ncbi:rhomboid family intramembrane serine protease [Leptospira wolffii]|uniref:Rhomboid family intramembrane serine protease n=1 Tax=Leptospira wolffii TaxID=409998 RepID=A0A2M9ZH55_9LEPT|nr:rhomboid family intramembrane serine protease [Leptospira wolffii]PJZ67761.1 rhomboid family intramembrane serine protease [Leptospira wolffii]